MGGSFLRSAVGARRCCGWHVSSLGGWREALLWVARSSARRDAPPAAPGVPARGGAAREAGQELAALRQLAPLGRPEAVRAPSPPRPARCVPRSLRNVPPAAAPGKVDARAAARGWKLGAARWPPWAATRSPAATPVRSTTPGTQPSNICERRGDSRNSHNSHNSHNSRISHISRISHNDPVAGHRCFRSPPTVFDAGAGWGSRSRWPAPWGWSSRRDSDGRRPAERGKLSERSEFLPRSRRGGRPHGDPPAQPGDAGRSAVTPAPYRRRAPRIARSPASRATPRPAPARRRPRSSPSDPPRRAP